MPAFTNTRTLLGDTGALDALVSHSLEVFADDIITEIGDYGFYNHNELKTIYLPNLMRIGNYAFQWCTSLERLYVGYQNQVATCGTYSFLYAGHPTIVVPDNMLSAYKLDSSWAAFSDLLYSDSDPYIPVWDESAIEDDAETIASYVNAGTACTRYKVGQYKVIDLGSEGQIRFQIVGMNMRELADSTQKAQLEWMAMELLNTPHAFNANTAQTDVEGTGTIGGYDKSDLKTYIDNDIWGLFPSVWKQIIKETKIISNTRTSSSTNAYNYESTAKLRIPNAKEICKASDSNIEEASISYGFAFKCVPNSTLVRKTAGASSLTSGSTYWTRTTVRTSTNNIYAINNSAYSVTANCTNHYYICLAFST